MMIRDRIKALRRVPARELLPNPKNWRAHPKAQQDALRGLLAELGYCDATIARELSDGRLQLIDGHLRCETTPDMEVPVLVLDVSEAEADKLLATLDPLAALAEADPRALTALLASLETDSSAVQDLLTDLAAGELTPFATPDHCGGLTDPDEIPAPPDAPITRRGDLWLLGRHRLLCGDAGKAEDVDRLLEGAVIHLVNTDPPYGVHVEPRSNSAIAAGLSSYTTYGTAASGARSESMGQPKPLRAKDRPLINDFVSAPEFKRLLHAWFRNLARALLPGRGFYVWGGYANLANYPPVLQTHNLYFSQAIVWVKEHPVLTRKDFMGNFELAFYGWRQGAAHVFLGPNNATDVWSVKKVNPQRMVHLTEKPVELAARALQYSSHAGEHVLDLFGGSGSTLIAAEQLGRRAFLMEIDPLYCDVIVQRWSQFTGKKPERKERSVMTPDAAADDSPRERLNVTITTNGRGANPRSEEG
jgi:DNA modification methylase